MSQKPRQISHAIAALDLIIHGYLETNKNNGYSKESNLEYLLDALSDEIDSWAHILVPLAVSMPELEVPNQVKETI